MKDDVGPFHKLPPCARAGGVNHSIWKGGSGFGRAGQIGDDHKLVARGGPFTRQQINHGFDPANARIDPAVDEDFREVGLVSARGSQMGGQSKAPGARMIYDALSGLRRVGGIIPGALPQAVLFAPFRRIRLRRIPMSTSQADPDVYVSGGSRCLRLRRIPMSTSQADPDVCVSGGLRWPGFERIAMASFQPDFDVKFG